MQRRVADELLELRLRKLFRRERVEGLDDVVDDDGLTPRFEPDAHRVLADDDGEDERHREFKRTEPVDERRRGRERRDRGRMAARHPAVADQARKVDALRHNGMDDRLDELRPEPRRETDEQKGIRQQFLKPIHMFPLPFAVRALSALECSLLYHRFPVQQ